MTYSPRLAAYAHQAECLARMRGKPFALLMETGAGKSKPILDEYGEDCAQAGGLWDLFILAPAGCYMNWVEDKNERQPSEFKRHLAPELFAGLSLFMWKSGMGVGQKRALRAFLDCRDRPRALVMNIEALSSVAAARDAAAEFLSAKRATMVIDESTRIKRYDTQRTKNITALGKLARKRRILTGLVVPNSPLDLYSQFYFLDPKILGHYSYFTFRARYAIMRDMPVREWYSDPRTGEPTRRTAKIVVAYRNEGELNALIAPYSYRVLKKDCLDLPEKIYAPPHKVELTGEQRRIYDEIIENASSELESGAWVTATEVMTQMLRLQQVLCGFVKDENGVEHAVPGNRLKVLLEILEDHSGKAIIWTRFDRCVREIGAALVAAYGPDSTALFWGANRATRAEEERRFLTDPKCRWIVSTPASGGYGNTWVEATLSVYHDNDFDLEHRVQSEDRNHRVGQHNPVTYADLIAPGTMDEKVVAALRAKIDVAAAIMGDGPRTWLI